MILLVIAFTLGVIHQTDATSVDDNGVEPVRRPTEFCKTYKYNHSVTAEGCETKYIDNNVCYGQCLTEYNIGYVTCKACWPTDLRKKVITLKCKNRVVKTVTVNIVMFCQCTRRRCPTHMPSYPQNAIQTTSPPPLPTTEQLNEAIKKILRRKRRKCKEKRSFAKRKCLRKFKECKRKLKGLLNKNDRRRRNFDTQQKIQLDKLHC